jgi:hypothetical protein
MQGKFKMMTFQFYVKDTTAVQLDIDSPTFSAEKDQLVEQGFERVGDVVQADNSEQAHEKFKSIHLDELGQFAGLHLVFGGIGSLLAS